MSVPLTTMRRTVTFTKRTSDLFINKYLMEPRSVLILGAGGCLGGYAVSSFKEAGWKVCSLTTSNHLETADLSLVVHRDRTIKE